MAHIPKPNKILLIAAAVVLVIVGLVFWKIASTHTNSDTTSSKTSLTPPFQTLLPNDTPVEKLGGWQKLTPPNNEPFYVYTDTINTVPIRVSEQPLPQTFKDSTDSKVAEVAKGYSATETFAAGDTKVYIGTNAKGPQSVIFTKSGLLVLITSDSGITNDAWKNYVTSLH